MGHPDKLADQISDGILDAILLNDPDGRVACETLVTTNMVIISGEISTIKHPNYDKDPGSYPWVAEPDVVKDLFESMGIGDNTTVVCYDTSGGLWAARFWWVLNYYGHNNA